MFPYSSFQSNSFIFENFDVTGNGTGNETQSYLVTFRQGTLRRILKVKYTYLIYIQANFNARNMNNEDDIHGNRNWRRNRFSCMSRSPNRLTEQMRNTKIKRSCSTPIQVKFYQRVLIKEPTRCGTHPLTTGSEGTVRWWPRTSDLHHLSYILIYSDVSIVSRPTMIICSVDSRSLGQLTF